MLTKTFWLNLMVAITIGRYLPILGAPPIGFMALIPFSEFDPATGRLPASNPAAGIVNPVLNGYCSVVQPVANFYRDTLNRVTPGLGDIYTAPARAIQDRVCPGLPPPPNLPIPSPPLYAPTVRAASSGRAAGSRYGLVSGSWIFVTDYEDIWTCGDNRGFPIEGIRLYSEAGGRKFLGCLCMRVDGTTYIQIFTPSTNESPTERIVVTEARFDPCPGSTPIPIRPAIPVLPERPIPPLPPVPPEIPVTIDLPRLPGFPPLSFPIVYAPIAPQLTLNAPITLAPRVNINPSFSFAPKIELNLGGISIEGGGYPETIGDVIEIVNEGGGACPDPCPPLDYNLIRQIAIQELDAKFPPTRPFTNQTQLIAAADSGQIALPEFAQSLSINIVTPPRNRSEQEGNANAPNVFFNGWYSFGTTSFTGDRKPIQYDNQSLPIPPGAKTFSYTIIGFGTAAITISYLLEV